MVGWGGRGRTKKHRKLGRWVAPSMVLRRWSSPQAGGRGLFVEVYGYTGVVGYILMSDSVRGLSRAQHSDQEKRPLGELQQHFSKFHVYVYHVGIL